MSIRGKKKEMRKEAKKGKGYHTPKPKVETDTYLELLKSLLDMRKLNVARAKKYYDAELVRLDHAVIELDEYLEGKKVSK